MTRSNRALANSGNSGHLHLMKVNTLILGAGAAGLHCAAYAGPDTLVIDHAKAPGEKIRISGGGRCNFTNMYAGPQNFLSGNPHFCKSALSRFTQWDFVDLVSQAGIGWHEKTLGQLFCDDTAKDIVALLMRRVTQAGGQVWLRTEVANVRHDGSKYVVDLDREGRRVQIHATHLVLATGGKSIPKMGATGLAYDLARQFDLPMVDTRPALVPFTFADNRFSPLSGTATPVRAQAGSGPSFDEAMLLTHRGLSGPAMLQISSFWREGDTIHVNLDPDGQLLDSLREQRSLSGRKAITTELGRHLPAKLVAHLAQDLGLSGNLADQSDARLGQICTALQNWILKPTGTEGYRTAEVTLGGISTDGLQSKTMMARDVPGLFVIGEAADVTGWLGGYNFQWAWSSGYAAGVAIRA